MAEGRLWIGATESAINWTWTSRRRGKKKAVVAVAYTMLVTIYHMLKHELPYRELGANYFDRLNVTYIKKHFVSRLEDLGYKVTLEPVQLAA